MAHRVFAPLLNTLKKRPAIPRIAAALVGFIALAASCAAQSRAAAPAADQPQMKSTTIEFVPGEKTIFFDDFSDMEDDAPPPHWKVREGKVELRTGGGTQELYAAEGVTLSTKIAVPSNFTFELQFVGSGEMVWKFRSAGDEVLAGIVRGEDDGQTVNISWSGKDGDLGAAEVKGIDTSKPVDFALWVQQGRVRAYVNRKRVLDVNQVQIPAIDEVVVDDARYRPTALRKVRIAESASDFSAVIASTGKYVTHGILFDIDSARLKPESAAILKQVAAALAKNPNLKLEIDGYTDSVGNDAHNLDLSKRRAQAVQSVLVSQFGIDAGRLTSDGFGVAKPIDSNDTPGGRANNRRVEFLKR